VKEREIVMIGLGAFGSKVNEDFRALLADRRSLMSPAEQDRVGVFQVDFPCDAPFDFEAYHAAIETAVRNSYSRNNNLPFDFYLVGNLGEIGVAMQAVDIAYLLHVMDGSGILRIEDSEQPGSVVSFLTYSDLLGSSRAYTQDQVSAFAWFLERCVAAARERRYEPPYADPNGKGFSPVLRQPFDRNYLFQTPGDDATIHDQTAKVFCERLFIELMVLEPDYKRNIRKAQRNLADTDAPFCSFCFYQVPRLADMQRYMLKFRYEDFCLDLSRGKPLPSATEKSLKEKFLRLFDLKPGKEGEFPIERLAFVFKRRHASSFEGVIRSYAGSAAALVDHVDTCEQGIREIIARLDDSVLTMLREEFTHIKDVFLEGTRILFQAPALYGYFNYYLDFLEELRGHVLAWSESTISSDFEADKAAFASAVEKVKARLAILDAKPAIRLPVFAPLRREITERLLGSLPYHLLIDAALKEKLAEYLRIDYLDPARNSDHPLHVLDELIASLRGFIAQLGGRQSYVKEKLRLIDGMLDFYYVKSYSNSEGNRKVMERVALKYFSETRKRDLRSRYQKEIYNRWKQTFRDNAEFLHREEDFLIAINRDADQMLKSQEITSLLEIDREASSSFCSRLDADIRISLDRLAERSFLRIASRRGREDQLIIAPRSDGQDDLAEAVSRMSASSRSSEAEEWDSVLPIAREFTLGSVLFLREMLFMPVESMAKWERIKQYASSDIERREASLYHTAASESAEAARNPAGSPLTRREKAVRLVVKEFLGREPLLELYAKVTDGTATEVTDEVVEALARRASTRDVLSLLSDDDLRRTAREFDVIAGLEKARTINNIERFIDSL
jgi:hypothetical protein